MTPSKTILTIAGSDPSGGAGLQRDLETFRDCEMPGVSVVTTVTSQVLDEFRSLYALPLKMISQQLSILLENYSIAWAKTGLIFKRQTMDLLCRVFKRHPEIKLIVDPIMKASAGPCLLQPKALPSLKNLFQYAYGVTPNLSEAEILSDEKILDVGGMRKAALKIYRLGPRHVIIKGGHLPGEPVDLFYDGKDFHEFPKKRIEGGHFHGLGCRFSAALTAFLGRDFSMLDALSKAEDYVHQEIQKNCKL
ncbi:MAG: bifunctional hydroxymethylpyrimidine kinase/phosphomethylpyrimidine kinase [Chlamydiae bacterium]|nr:bifunctional hydroxymethylpyrimidine kinase/phosphomethylpyrimidine kinase [Chlamydiota bacterium]MBI3267179.1 bifunctional hydroxymethylpyrimidine kinase/phosphomethylpyrimidine kinase [Chlamydiota bacterium]